MEEQRKDKTEKHLKKGKNGCILESYILLKSQAAVTKMIVYYCQEKSKINNIGIHRYNDQPHTIL